MAETTEKIEDFMTHKREHLGSNLRVLEKRMRAATDWQSHFRNHPGWAIGAALGGGAILALLVLPSGPRRPTVRRLADRPPDRHQEEIHSYWNQLKSAAIAVAAQRIVGYADEAVPGFRQQMEKAGFSQG